MFGSAFVNLYTRDIEAGIRFYRDLLGFRETFRTPTVGTPEHVELTLNGFGIGLGTLEAARRVHGIDASPGSRAMVVVIDRGRRPGVRAPGLRGHRRPPATPPHRQRQSQRPADRPRRQPRRDRGEGGARSGAAF